MKNKKKLKKVHIKQRQEAQKSGEKKKEEQVKKKSESRKEHIPI